MRNHIKTIFLSAVSILFIFQLTAQERILHGRVTTLENFWIAGASIEVKSSKLTFYTDSMGNFAVPCNLKDKLTVSAEGFETQNAKVNKQIKYAAFNLVLTPDSDVLKHAIGYGYTSEEDKIQAVSSLSNEEFDFSMYPNLTQLIKGRFPGVQVINGMVVIRGRGSTTSSGDPLVIVDGVPTRNALKNIHPAMVKNISILRDGNTAIYGTRGANGIIIIETKEVEL